MPVAEVTHAQPALPKVAVPVPRTELQKHWGSFAAAARAAARGNSCHPMAIVTDSQIVLEKLQQSSATTNQM